MELPLGFEFEESVFAPSRERVASCSGSYAARRCEPGWFCEEMNSEDDVEVLTVKKFRGDLAYRQQEYQAALCEYSGCLLLLPSSNVAMGRDVKESQARCLAHLGRHNEALEIAAKLRNGATNTDHLTTVLNLQFAIYRSLECLEEMVTCLQQLICLHPFNPWDWKLLAETYMSLSQSRSPSLGSDIKLRQCRGLTTNHTCKASPGLFGRETESPQEKHSWREDFYSQHSSKTNDIWAISDSISTTEKSERQNKVIHAAFGDWRLGALKDVCIHACASFVRARLLLQLTQSQQSSFALESNLKTQQEIEDKVKGFGLKEEALLLITEAMGEDLLPEKLKEDIQGEVKCVGTSALTSLVTVSAADFEDKWFQKLKVPWACG
uniref:Chromosome 8 open reading frame 76 n=1 Tax=Sphenodon punctatus TaxID=8508 RepID=A0A8D0G8X6_SPHPU